MKQAIYNKLIGTDGIVACCVAPKIGTVRHGTHTSEDAAAGWDRISLHAIHIARVADRENVTVLLGEKRAGPQRRIIVARWPEYDVAVEVAPDHPVSKSLPRLLRRTGVKFGGLEVQSRTRSEPCNTEPPAPSFDDPKTEESSPSPEVMTPATGDSPEAR